MPHEFGRYCLTVAENIGFDEADSVHPENFSLENWFLGKEYGGQELSGGQWQRVALYRCLHKDAEFYVLDEPTAYLDPSHEAEAVAEILEQLKDKTVLIITHRIGICRLMDQVIVMDKSHKIAGTGIFLSICIYVVFLVFGLFGSEKFIRLFAGSNQKVIEMGTTYLKICCCFSYGSIGFTVYERFLQSTGKTHFSTIAQISGALTNIILDYIFIYPMKMGVAGAALATIIGQFVSLFVAMYFHFYKNKEINGNICYIKANASLINGIYMIGASAALMQGLLAVMMAGMNAILGLAQVDPALLIGSFGIYYKIQQIALFSAFGLSNTIISILSFNYGMKDRKRIDECIKFGIVDTIIVSLMITLLFELLAHPLSQLFGLSGSTQEMIDICSTALHIASLGFVFMGISVVIQGVLQSIGYAIRPLIIALLRLVIFVFPIAYFFTLTENVTTLVWWTFPISELLTVIVSFILLKNHIMKE